MLKDKNTSRANARCIPRMIAVNLPKDGPRDCLDQPERVVSNLSFSAELLAHWIACRGYRFGDAEVIE